MRNVHADAREYHPRKNFEGRTHLVTAAPYGTERRHRCCLGMQPSPDMEMIFPIKDAASAALMAIKAGYLHKAGVISVREKQWVDSRVRTFLDDDSLIAARRESATPSLPASLVDRW